MTAACRRHRWPAAIVFASCLAACQPLFHPFADDRPPADLLKVPDTASVTIAPIEGEPRLTAAALAAAMAKALQQRDIAASDKTTSLGSYALSGTIRQSPKRKDGTAELTVDWQLRDAAGFTLAKRTERLAAPAQKWTEGDEAVVARLAAASATQIAAAMLDQAPVEAAVVKRTRLAIRKVKGATGDGGTSLTAAITAILKRQDLEIVTDPSGKADLYLDGEVAVAPPKAGKQHVKIVWHVRRPDGSEIGMVGQENDVPTGLLNGPWGDIAYTVAMSAGDGIMALVARGRPPDKS
jgi:ABC-type transport auxiliary lipoprotein component